MNIEQKKALWEKLRADPDFQPEWFLAIGKASPEPEGAHTQWGDGFRDEREHLIVDLSFAEGWVKCRCGTHIGTDMGNAALKQLWDVHRGLTTAREDVYASGSLATDDEVSDFLRRVSDPSAAYTPDEGFVQGGVPIANEALAHANCAHGPGGYCYVGYAALNLVIENPELVPA